MNNDVRGIYYILNTINKKIYIGSSCHINRRFYEHKYFLDKNMHTNGHLQKAWNKYGKNNFEFGIIELIDLKEDLLEIEQIWMDYFNSYNDKNGYNVSAYAEGSGGYEVTEETREKIRTKSIGRRASEETKKKLSSQRVGELNNFYGKHHSEETKKKLHDLKIGIKATENQMKGLNQGRMIANYGERSKEIHKKSALKRSGENCATAKLKEKDVIEILTRLQSGELEKDMATSYDVSIQTISRIKNRKRWGYLYEQRPELYA